MGSMMGGAGGGASAGSVASGLGEGASAINNYFAIGGAADTQNKALDNVYANLTRDMDPAVINSLAAQYDSMNATNRLALQKQIDPQLAAQRTVSEQKLSDQLSQIGQANSDKVAQAATAQGLAGVSGLTSGTADLVSAARQQLAAGATLPADVQAQLMQSGLEQTGAVTGAATARGAGGTILQQILGTAGINLQQQRQQQAAQLMTAASNLDTQRSQILQNLFPRLQQQQMSNIAGASGILQQSNSMMPQSGLTGTEVSNLWLARLGAQNANIMQKAGVSAQATLGQAGAMGQLAGSFGTALGGGGSGGGSKTSAGLDAFNFNSSNSAGQPSGAMFGQMGGY